MDHDEILTLEEAAAVLNLSPKRCARFAKKRRITARKVGGQWRFLRRDLENTQVATRILIRGHWGNMHFTEAKLDEMVAALIAKHFPGLKQRPAQFREIRGVAGTAKANMLFNPHHLESASLEFLEMVIIHELIHCEMEDQGKGKGGGPHGRTFKRRAKQLGIPTSATLWGWFS